MEKLIVGLGNPGKEYDNTRHNIGWMALSELSFYSQLDWKKKFKGEFAGHNQQGQKIYVLKPMTYMNLSGESVQALVHFFKIEVENILVVYDEIDLPFGTMVLKSGGGLAGHNGLKSLAQSLGTQNFDRLRLGVGKPAVGSVSDYVLKPFSSDEKTVLPNFLQEAAKAVELYIAKGFQEAARAFSKKSVIEET